MQIFALIAVAIASLIGVMIGLEGVPPPTPSVAPAATAPAGPSRSLAPAVPQAAPAPLPIPPPVTDGGGTAPIVMPELSRSADTAAPKCNIEACKAAYRSFTEADCTYQPLEGPRRLCTR